MQKLEHEHLKKIKTLWIEFDPIGVYKFGIDWPDDEYNDYVIPTYELLKNNASYQELETYILYLVNEYMGVPNFVNKEQITRFINKLQVCGDNNIRNSL